MTDKNIRHAGLGTFFQACAIHIALSRRIQRSQYFAEEALNGPTGHGSTVFGPVGFHHAGLRILFLDDKAVFLPERLGDIPGFIFGHTHNQPAMVTLTLDLGNAAGAIGQNTFIRALFLSDFVFGIDLGKHGRTRSRHIRRRVLARITRARQIRGDIQRRCFSRGAVIDLLRFRQIGAASSQTGQNQYGGLQRTTRQQLHQIRVLPVSWRHVPARGKPVPAA